MKVFFHFLFDTFLSLSDRKMLIISSFVGDWLSLFIIKMNQPQETEGTPNLSPAQFSFRFSEFIKSNHPNGMMELFCSAENSHETESIWNEIQSISVNV